jgi:hypothetical protein
MKPRQSPEIAFENREWKVIARVVKHPTKPGYDIVVERIGSGDLSKTHHVKTLRDAVIGAMDIAGVV